MRCPICSQQTFHEWGRVSEYSILRCRGCGLGVTSPFPSQEEIIKINEEVYRVDQRIQTYLSRQSYFEKRYWQYIDYIKNFKKNGKLLDIGCNIGLFLNVARQEGFEVVGVELNKGCAEYGKKNFKLEIYTDYLENIAFPADSFDVITLFDVLEHIPDLYGFITEVRRILKSDGLLVLQSPNIDSLMARLTKSRWNWLTPPDHLFHFTPENMTRFLKSNGFCIKKVKTWEPAEEFYNNLLWTTEPKSLLGRGLLKIFKITKIPLILVLLLQRVWWRWQKGGLIEIYVTKSGEAN